MPNEPPETSFADKIRHLAYPCRERGGVVWTYMNAAGEGDLPSLPNLAANSHSGEECRPWAAQRHCNWLQGLEGDIDLTHAAFLHSFLKPRFASQPGSFAYYSERAKVPLPFLVQKDYGILYGLRYPAEDDSYLWLIGHFLLPFYTMVNSIDLGVQFVTRAWVPIDDEHVMFWYFWWGPEGLREPDPEGGRQAFSYMRDFDYLPNTSDWRGRWQLAANASNDYEMDRQLQRTKNYTGIATVHNQDQAMTESMGSIVDRTQEHTGPADGTIINARKSLINAAQDLTERGVVPVTVSRPELYELRSGRIVLPRDTDWIEATEEQRKALASAAQT
jgi:phenylpropionate dioxygenase-like ring-hydroxylating dioxygenase large terminal subunit